MQPYWEKITSSRISRRRMLSAGAAAGGALAALSLVGCGGGGTTTATSKDRSGLIALPQDTTAQAKLGGILPSYLSTTLDGLDGMISGTAQTRNANLYAYSRLVQPKVFNKAKGEKVLPTLEGDAAESWEFSPDGLQLTFKLRPNLGMDPRPPTSGRIYDASDVKFAWDRFSRIATGRGVLANSVNKDAPVLDVSTPDARTVVIKLAYPPAALLPYLHFYLNGWELFPKEADGGFEPKGEMHGSGPFIVNKFQPSVIIEYRRNPNWWRKDRPFLDGIDQPTILEYAQGLAQFRAGRIGRFGVLPDDVLTTKSDVPDLVMLLNRQPSRGYEMVFFDATPKSEWLDERLRQALSMQVDRDLFIETTNNIDRYRQAGIDLPYWWNSSISSGYDDVWLDPKGKEIGEGGKYYQHNIAEAKKLVKAATGKDSPYESTWNFAQNGYGEAYIRRAQILQNMFEEGGNFKLKVVTHDQASRWLVNVQGAPTPTGGHVFDGVGLGGVADYPDVDNYFDNFLVPGGSYYKFEEGFPNDPTWTSLLKTQKTELDAKKRASILKEFQQYAAKKVYFFPSGGSVSSLSLRWPWVGNDGAFGAWTDVPGTTLLHLWLDTSKMKS